MPGKRQPPACFLAEMFSETDCVHRFGEPLPQPGCGTVSLEVPPEKLPAVDLGTTLPLSETKPFGELRRRPGPKPPDARHRHRKTREEDWMAGAGRRRHEGGRRQRREGQEGEGGRRGRWREGGRWGQRGGGQERREPFSKNASVPEPHRSQSGRLCGVGAGSLREVPGVPPSSRAVRGLSFRLSKLNSPLGDACPGWRMCLLAPGRRETDGPWKHHRSKLYRLAFSCLPQPINLRLRRSRLHLNCLAERLRARPKEPRCALRALVLFEQQRAGLLLANLAVQMCSRVLCRVLPAGPARANRQHLERQVRLTPARETAARSLSAAASFAAAPVSGTAPSACATEPCRSRGGPRYASSLTEIRTALAFFTTALPSIIG